MGLESEARINYRLALQFLWDGASWTVAVLFATFLRYDGNPDAASLRAALILGFALGTAQVILGWTVQRIRGRRIVGSFDEISVLTFTAGAVTIAVTIAVFLLDPLPVPRSVPFIAGTIALTAMLGGRFVLRAYRQRSLFSRDGDRVLIYGAGESGDQIIRQMLATPTSKFIPVAIIDDNPRKFNLRVQGIRVVGSSSDLEQIARRTAATTLVVAIAGIDSKQLLDLDSRCKPLNVALRVIPTASEIIGGAVKLGDISHVTDEDLLGRRPIETDEVGISKLLKGKRILITGAGGSIGSELARQVHRYQPAFVGILDRDESAIHAVQLTIDGRGLLDSENLILADIRDSQWMLEIMETTKPDIVFHAAALKHLPLLERYPNEGHKTNVLGTQNVINACRAAGVSVFINISTDKAADPTCVLGHTKLMTERMTASVEPVNGERFMSVRFGNVLGSRGSVLTAFRHQIEHGGPVTVTDARATRYFMTIPEAVHLVLQAAVIGEHSETLILDMGEPVLIDDVAKQMIEKSGRDIKIVYTGLRPGEKPSEVLVARSENAVIKSHPLIFHTRVAPIQVTNLESHNPDSMVQYTTQ
jgi:dTDP-glucose 4,6-dehydratase